MKKRFLCALLIAVMLILPVGAWADVLELPNDLTEIQTEAFMNTGNLDVVVLPETVQTIGDRAFQGSSVNSIYLPMGITSIGKDAFSDCDNLTVTVEEDSYALNYCIENGVRCKIHHLFEITSVSPMGASDGCVRGRLLEGNPEDYNILVYIYVAGRWYVKPYWDPFWTDLNADGTFKTLFVTNGNLNDSNAETISVLLLPKENVPTTYPDYYTAQNLSVDEIIINHADYTPNFTELVFEDNFDGTELNASEWTCETGNGFNGWGNWEAEYYKPENANVSDGTLKLTAKPETVEDGINTRQCTSARIRSKFNFKYGRLEVRARCDSGDAIWPGIWMLPVSNAYGIWPYSGEIDLYEARGGLPDRWHAALHYPRLDNPNESQNNAKVTYYSDSDGMTGWHVYTLDWTSDAIIWKIDGAVVQMLTDWQTPGQPYPAPFDQNFYVILNLAVGGEFNKPLYGNTDVQPGTFAEGDRTFEIDYVRIYQ